MIHSLKDLLVVSDMDGTLLMPDQSLPECNLETIKLFTQLGGRFTVASGRIAESVEKYEQLAPYLSPGITCNGCVVYDFAHKKPLFEQTVPIAVAKQAVKDMMEKFPQLGVLVFAADGNTYLCNASGATGLLLEEEQIRFLSRPFEDLPDRWNKVIFAASPALLEEVEGYVRQREYPGVYFVFSSAIFFEMLPEGASKGSALVKLAQILEIPLGNVFVIGDYYNDLSMMETAGHSVAMAGAPADVRLAADEVCESCEAGGVGQYLYKLIRLYG